MAKNLNDLTDDELLVELADAKEELFNLRFQLVTGQLENVRRVAKVKRDVARTLTKLREREIAAAENLVAQGAE